MCDFAGRGVWDCGAVGRRDEGKNASADGLARQVQFVKPQHDWETTTLMDTHVPPSPPPY